MVDPYGEIDFLTRSANRVTVLRSLAESGSTRSDLVRETDMSETTVDRILAAFADRGWIEETDETDAREPTFETTRLGQLLTEDYDRFADSMDLACRLGPYRDLLPIEAFDFDIRLLSDATVTDPDRLDTLQSADRWAELIRVADRVRFFANTANELIVRVMRDQVVEHDTSHESIFTPDLYDYVRGHPGLCELIREMILAGATFYRAADGTESTWFLAIYDDLVGVGGFDDSGTIQTGFESEARPVFEWADDTFEAHRAEATRLTADDFDV